MQLVPQWTVANDDKLDAGNGQLHLFHGANHIFTAFFFDEAPNEENHIFPGDCRIWCELLGIHANVVNDDFVFRKTTFPQAAGEKTRNGNDADRRACQFVPAPQIAPA